MPGHESRSARSARVNDARPRQRRPHAAAFRRAPARRALADTDAAARGLLSRAAERGGAGSGSRTILWVGRGERFPAQVADAPLLDVVFERDVEAAAAHPLASFDACVLDAPEPEIALAGVRRLRARRGCPPILVRLDYRA